MSVIVPAAPGLSAAPQASQREQLHTAAKQFEAIFVRQMLAAARRTSFDDGGLFSGQAMQTFRQMQDDRFADLASESGALGLATIIEAQMARFLPPETATGAAGTDTSGKGDA